MSHAFSFFTLSLVPLLALASGDAPSKAAAAPPAKTAKRDALAFTMKDINGKDVDLGKYRGKVVLMVNTASECGYTPQYAELEALHEKYSGKGLAVLGFPANEFGAQEPGTNEEIKTFCQKNYGVQFDMFSKVVVKGEGQAPLYVFLTSPESNPSSGGEVKWNFTKFLIGRDGQIVSRFESKVKPTSEEMTRAIEAELAKQAG